MKIPVLVSPQFSRPTQLDAAISLLNANQNEFAYELTMKEEIPLASEVITPNTSRTSVLDLRSAQPHSAIITEAAFNNNWFSMTSASGSIISTYSWEEVFAPPALKTYLQLELILHTTACLGDLTDPLMASMSHPESIGCLFDFCESKTEVKYKIIGGHLCGTCSEKLASYGVGRGSISTIRHLLDIMRLDSIGRAIKVSSDVVFAAMRFSSNDENDNSYKYGVVPAFESLGLKVHRGDTIPSSGSLIEKVFRMIDESWAVVVLASSINLNVFFEYGYAVGHNKPIFLITSKSQFASSPTDIKGFEQIVYDDGNYEALKAEIVRHMKAMPRFSK